MEMRRSREPTIIHGVSKSNEKEKENSTRNQLLSYFGHLALRVGTEVAIDVIRYKVSDYMRSNSQNYSKPLQIENFPKEIFDDCSSLPQINHSDVIDKEKFDFSKELLEKNQNESNRPQNNFYQIKFGDINSQDNDSNFIDHLLKMVGFGNKK